MLPQAPAPPDQPLSRNIRLYGWIKVFNKRVYLPLITIYLVEVGHLSLAQIGALVTISALSSLAAGIPTGYFADRVKRKTSIVIGAYVLALSALIFVLNPQFPGAVLATIVEALGFSFISGAGEAIMHDTLAAMGLESQYVKIMGRAQSFGLIGNIILVGLVPMTYTIDKRLPFILGFIASLTLGTICLFLVEPPRIKPKHLTGNVYAGLVRSLRTFINRRSIWIFVAYGVLSAFYVVYANYINLVYKNLGINIGLIGLIYAASSIVGAVGGWYIHQLRRIPFLAYTLFDVFMATFTMIIIGATRNLWVAVIMGLINLGFWRLRSIMYQDYLLARFGHHGSKATLISALSFFDNLNETWLPIVFVAATTTLGFYTGFIVLGAAGFVVMGGLFIVGVQALGRNPQPG